MQGRPPTPVSPPADSRRARSRSQSAPPGPQSDRRFHAGRFKVGFRRSHVGFGRFLSVSSMPRADIAGHNSLNGNGLAANSQPPSPRRRVFPLFHPSTPTPIRSVINLTNLALSSIVSLMPVLPAAGLDRPLRGNAHCRPHRSTQAPQARRVLIKAATTCGRYGGMRGTRSPVRTELRLIDRGDHRLRPARRLRRPDPRVRRRRHLFAGPNARKRSEVHGNR
jgi:hypothetical protein